MSMRFGTRGGCGLPIAVPLRRLAPTFGAEGAGAAARAVFGGDGAQRIPIDESEPQAAEGIFMDDTTDLRVTCDLLPWPAPRSGAVGYGRARGERDGEEPSKALLPEEPQKDRNMRPARSSLRVPFLSVVACLASAVLSCSMGGCSGPDSTVTTSEYIYTSRRENAFRYVFELQPRGTGNDGSLRWEVSHFKRTRYAISLFFEDRGDYSAFCESRAPIQVALSGPSTTREVVLTRVGDAVCYDCVLLGDQVAGVSLRALSGSSEGTSYPLEVTATGTHFLVLKWQGFQPRGRVQLRLVGGARTFVL